MKVTVRAILIIALGTIHKRLLRGLQDLEIRGQLETTALSRSARILWWVLETWEDLLSLKHQWKTICLFLCEELSRSQIIIIIIIKIINRKWKKKKKNRISPKNKSHKNLRDFGIQTDHQILARLPNLMAIKNIKKEMKLTVLWILPFQRTTEWK